ncbi:FAD:protein FMN transferase [Clostridium sp. SHJSY1]|nr:FAD:protein FMN transferase [Clostridium sp. SHJSY1]MDS0526455.1 FAD:protein FMN transferase [Clostridium sp. SHJSY1]
MILITIELVLLLLVIFMLILIISTRNNKDTLTEKRFYVLGTIIYLKAFGKKSESAIKEAFDYLIDIDNRMSAFKDDSEISIINKNAGIKAKTVSSDTFSLIEEAIKYSELSEGAFDPTIRPVVSLWGIGTKSERKPKKDEIQEKLKLVNYKDIILNKKDNSVGLKNKYQSIDLGGIAKGYATDEITKIFKKNGIKTAIIDLGGNIFVLGNKNNGTSWNVGIQDPIRGRGEHVGVLSLKDKSVVTSGNYERFFIKENEKFHHIIDPSTGYPLKSNVLSATIISDKSIDGDGLSTGVYIMGIEKARNLIESISGIDAIFITEDKNVYITSGIKENFIVTNEEYILN